MFGHEHVGAERVVAEGHWGGSTLGQRALEQRDIKAEARWSRGTMGQKHIAVEGAGPEVHWGRTAIR